MKKKILITGGTGFIGSHLAETLIRNGHKVRVFDRYNPNYNLGNLENSNLKSKIDFVFGDIRDYDSVLNAAKNCDIIFHLAALIGIPYSYVSPLAYIKTNIEGTYNILEAAKKLKTKKIFITSTSEVYGSAKYLPIDEKHPLQPQSPYSASKIAADNISLSYYSAFNLPVNILRPFNVFWPRQTERAIIPSVINQIYKSNDGKIFLGNLSPKREFNYIEDICSAFVKSINIDQYGHVIHVGNGYEITIKDLVKKISKLMKKKVIILQKKERVRPKLSEVNILKSSNIKARKLLKWKPKYSGNTGLENGLNKSIEWYLKNISIHKKNKYIL